MLVGSIPAFIAPPLVMLWDVPDRRRTGGRWSIVLSQGQAARSIGRSVCWSLLADTFDDLAPAHQTQIASERCSLTKHKLVQRTSGRHSLEQSALLLPRSHLGANFRPAPHDPRNPGFEPHPKELTLWNSPSTPSCFAPSVKARHTRKANWVQEWPSFSNTGWPICALPHPPRTSWPARRVS